MSFPFKKIEAKWKKYWEEHKTHQVNIQNSKHIRIKGGRG
jgi:leucyl-tRNA synthetase